MWNDLPLNSSLNKIADEKCVLHRKLNRANYRLLARNKQEKDSCIVNFKEEMPPNEMKQYKCISNNKKGTNGKYKRSCSSSLYTNVYGKNVENNKCGITKTKKYIDFEKQIFKKLDYKDYLKNIKTIEDKEYKKLARKKRRIRIALILLYFFVLILPVLDLSLGKYKSDGLLGLLGLLYISRASETGTTAVEGYLSKLFDISGWGMIYYYKKVIKYENIKFKRRSNKN
ncbi:Plasmodium exported protein (Pm-fam-a like), unknown function [Plasmodium malariae]|uniref:Fam-l protein n=1 Tax=Plasmodium malariae TaxID=5858 RepID=A0A1A8X993_PLAMA|nr:Plasmodium exported protein (Pm-fam-a like), unknown function [Plasmodium malariae]